ncbi:hypothetical protein [Streptomyces thermospinosisporus]|uniref:hypothetical protein n=1 Tax=Streptomyces thermospinosisporus TaxID=161482 RepID=UPI0031E0AFFE
MARRLLIAVLAIAMTVAAAMTSAAAQPSSWQHVPPGSTSRSRRKCARKQG